MWLCPVLSAAMSDSVLVLDTGPVWKRYEDMSASINLNHNFVSENNGEKQESSTGSRDGLTFRKLGKVINEMSKEEKRYTNLFEAALVLHIIAVMRKVSI